jgi:LuxR family transcriptional regulator, maltose regulon positive regulatory protein
VSLLLSNLAPTWRFSPPITILGDLHAALCQAVVPSDDAAERLAGWHATPRSSRPSRRATGCACTRWRATNCAAASRRLLPDEQAALQARAADGLSAGWSRRRRGARWRPARREAAYDLATRSLCELLMVRGRQVTVLEWLARMPAEEVNRRPRLLLAAA